MAQLGHSSTDENVEAFFADADINGDGLIDFDEFLAIHDAADDEMMPAWERLKM